MSRRITYQVRVKRLEQPVFVHGQPAGVLQLALCRGLGTCREPGPLGERRQAVVGQGEARVLGEGTLNRLGRRSISPRLECVLPGQEPAECGQGVGRRGRGTGKGTQNGSAAVAEQLRRDTVGKREELVDPGLRTHSRDRGVGHGRGMERDIGAEAVTRLHDRAGHAVIGAEPLGHAADPLPFREADAGACQPGLHGSSVHTPERGRPRETRFEEPYEAGHEVSMLRPPVIGEAEHGEHGRYAARSRCRVGWGDRAMRPGRSRCDVGVRLVGSARRVGGVRRDGST